MTVEVSCLSTVDGIVQHQSPPSTNSPRKVHPSKVNSGGGSTVAKSSTILEISYRLCWRVKHVSMFPRFSGISLGVRWRAACQPHGVRRLPIQRSHLMRALISAGSASMLAMLTLSSSPATACDWGGWSGCGCGSYGYGAIGYYGAPAYAYVAPQVYAPPAYGYAPAYYAPPPIYYAPPPYYAGPTVASYLPPGNYSPPGYYARPSYGVPYSQPYGGR